MKKYDLRPVIDAIRETVKNHELDVPGAYRRWNWQNEAGTRNLGINEYGCADALNILYTMGELASDDELRRARINVLQSLQNPESGMFVEATHNTVHTTAHCAAALELFDAEPLYPIKALHKYMSKEGIAEFLESIDWRAPWPESHKGAGIYAALVNSGEMTRELEDYYFDWLWENTDPVTGFWRAGYANRARLSSDDQQFEDDKPVPLYNYLAGGFHYMFNHEYAKRPLRYPDKIIDSSLLMFRKNCLRKDFGRRVGFLEIDWLYCLTRSSRQTAHRFAEVKEAISDFAEIFCGYLLDLVSSGEYKKHELFNDLHMLFGCICCIAELQEAMPGCIITEKPLRLVLNRRPFI